MPNTLVLLCVWIALCSARVVAVPPDGLYHQSEDPAASAVTTGDGRTIHLGAPDDAEIRRVELLAQNNANTRYMLTLHVPHDPGRAALRSVLVVDGVAHRQTSGGSSGYEEASLAFTISGRAPAAAIAHHFGIEPRLRRHPGHRLLVEFETATGDSDPIRIGDDVHATVRLTNVGDEPVAFMQGGRNRSNRDNQYELSARLLGRQVADVGTAMHFGGLAVKRTIEPGESFEDTVDLRLWFAFDEPGHYEVLGSYSVELLDPVDPSWRTIWEDYLTARFVVRIEPASRATGDGTIR